MNTRDISRQPVGRRTLSTAAAATMVCGLIAGGVHAANPDYAPPQSNPFGLADAGAYTSHAFVDIDGDLDMDLFTGNQAGNVRFQRNNGNSTNPVFGPLSGTGSPPFGLPSVVEAFACPDFADIDGDGDSDLFVGGIYGQTFLFENTGNSSAPAFASVVLKPFGIMPVANTAAPAFADIDGDGDLDVFVGQADGHTKFQQNTGNKSQPAFAAAVTDPFGLTGLGLDSDPCTQDFDGDGDVDLMFGNGITQIRYFQNTGNATNPLFAAHVVNPFGFVAGDIEAAPETVDLNGDYKPDLVVGDLTGTVRYFRNSTSTFEAVPPSSVASISLTATADISVDVAFTATDDITGVSATKLWVKRPGDATYSYTGLQQFGTSGTFSYTFSGLQGVYQFYTIAADHAVNVEAPPATPDDTVLLDRTAPVIPLGIVRLNPTTSDLDAVEFSIVFTEAPGASFATDDIIPTGSVGVAHYHLSTTADPKAFVAAVVPNDPEANGTLGLRINGLVEDAVGNDLAVPVDSPLYTITNYAAGDVDKNGAFNIADVALLADANLGLVTLP